MAFAGSNAQKWNDPPPPDRGQQHGAYHTRSANSARAFIYERLRWSIRLGQPQISLHEVCDHVMPPLRNHLRMKLNAVKMRRRVISYHRSGVWRWGPVAQTRGHGVWTEIAMAHSTSWEAIDHVAEQICSNRATEQRRLAVFGPSAAPQPHRKVLAHQLHAVADHRGSECRDPKSRGSQAVPPA